MWVGRLTCSPVDALRACLAICGALGRASVKSDAANQRSLNMSTLSIGSPGTEDRRTQEEERPIEVRHLGVRSRSAANADRRA